MSQEIKIDEMLREKEEAAAETSEEVTAETSEEAAQDDTAQTETSAEVTAETPEEAAQDDTLQTETSVEVTAETPAEAAQDDTAQTETTEEVTQEVQAPATAEEGAAIIEAILFTMGESVDAERLAKTIGVAKADLPLYIDYLKEKYDRAESGIGILELEGAVQLCTKKEMYPYLIRIAKAPKKVTLTESLLETLSIVAYKQPITRIEIERIRGVNSDHSVNRLIELSLIREIGRMDAPGRPLMFGTTEEFLRSFGVKNLDELPSLNAVQVEEFKREAEDEVNVKLDI